MAEKTPMQELTEQLVVDNRMTQQDADSWIEKERIMIVGVHYLGQVSGKNQGPTIQRAEDYYNQTHSS